VQSSAMGKEAETRTETQTGLAVAQDDSAGPGGFAASSVECRVRSPGLWTGRKARSFDSCYQKISFRSGRKKLLDRPKPFPYVHLRRAVDPESGMERSASRAMAILDQTDVLAGGVSDSNSADGSPPRPSECVPVVLVA
jgi:hypothetical protein